MTLFSAQPLQQHSSYWIRYAFLISTLILVCGLVLGITYSIARHTLYTQLEQEAHYHLAHLKSKLDELLMRHAYLPLILAKNPLIIDYLNTLNPEPAQQHTLNLYLADINQQAGTQDIYLKRPSGLTVAASNWQNTHTFIGQNYHFRPYFQQAMQGQLGRYYALGSASKERGYYFSYAVRNTQGQIIGVITVKINITHFEQDWTADQSPAEFMITDELGVIFMASQKEWSLHALTPLSVTDQQALNNTRRYNGNIIPALANTTPPLLLQASEWQWNKKTYTHLSHPLFQEGWTAHILMDRQQVQRQILWIVLITSLVLGMAGLLGYFAWRMNRQRRHYEQQTLEALEIKVEERTRELKQAQSELIQAAKMAALGQLAAGINHELNNPLSAIRVYADNAQQFMALNQYALVQSNLTEISQLTERMAAITHQLKLFSRKSHGSFSACSLEGAIQAALLIMHPQLLKQRVELKTTYVPHLPLVWADQIWLEQIMVNLMSNAIDATQAQQTRIIELQAYFDKTLVYLQVLDTGTGIRATDLEHLFEAFFTTKSVGQGLGLGLSISYRLAKDMRGNLSAANRATGGAIFTLSLLQAPDNHDTNSPD